MSKELTSSASRTRTWATIVYPDSAPSNWLDILSDFKVPCAISPLHCDDINPNGEKKKPHYHVVFSFDSVKSQQQVKDIITSFGGVGTEKVNSLRGYCRYLCHLDNPEKAQYSTKEVRTLFGLDYQTTISLNSDKYGLIREMLYFINTNQVYSFNQFLTWCSENNEDWFISLCDNTGWIIKEAIKSQYYSDKNLA